MVVTSGSCRWSFGCEATVHAPCRPIEDFAPREIDQGIASVGERTYQQLPGNAEKKTHSAFWREWAERARVAQGKP